MAGDAELLNPNLCLGVMLPDSPATCTAQTYDLLAIWGPKSDPEVTGTASRRSRNLLTENTTVTEELLEDAMGYRVSNPNLYKLVATRYNTTSSKDRHRELVDIIVGVQGKDPTALQKRDTTYSIKCSSANLAPREECYALLEYMRETRTDLGLTRMIDYYGDCYFRVGPYGSGGILRGIRPMRLADLYTKIVKEPKLAVQLSLFRASRLRIRGTASCV